MSWFSDAFKKIGRFFRRALAILMYITTVILYIAAIGFSIAAIAMGWNPIGWICAAIAAACMFLAFLSVNLASTIDQVDQLMALPTIIRYTLTFASIAPWAGSYADVDAVSAVQALSLDIEASRLEEEIYQRAKASVTLDGYPKYTLVDLTTGEEVATTGSTSDQPLPTRGDEPVVPEAPTGSTSKGTSLVVPAAIAGAALIMIANGDNNDNQSTRH